MGHHVSFNVHLLPDRIYNKELSLPLSLRVFLDIAFQQSSPELYNTNNLASVLSPDALCLCVMRVSICIFIVYKCTAHKTLNEYEAQASIHSHITPRSSRALFVYQITKRAVRFAVACVVDENSGGFCILAVAVVE